MKFYSTEERGLNVDLRSAMLKSLAPNGGLYMPMSIPTFTADDLQAMRHLSMPELSLEVAAQLLDEAIPREVLEDVIYSAVTFDAPVVMHNDRIGACELWHGPSLAFKDFGARFMAELMGYYGQSSEDWRTILVATSGDTGGAVGAGFHGVNGVEVVILYPKGKVSPLQELQLTTLGDNVVAVEVDGTFDDCQALVKKAFLDRNLEHKYLLSSANSINIARLIPQTFYYFRLWQQVKMVSEADLVVAVPSGNFGNLCAGVMAQQMGLPIKRFVAATNVNSVVPEYLESGDYKPRVSVATISNAMDVGAPSNFIRLQHLHGSTWNAMADNLEGFYLSDELTRTTMRAVYDQYKYICDPHGAIGFAALRKHLQEQEVGIYLETAHPAKFKATVDETLGIDCPVPDRLASLQGKTTYKETLGIDYSSFQQWLLARR